MSRTTLAILALTALPAIATAQADTTRRDTTRAPRSNTPVLDVWSAADGDRTL
ncbi:MAG TPA: hypothetical protein VFZ21_20860 [Gemmatimonadaceae bacterium]|jgi:hypothetical protein|nr:hypothetical protein [Gemmatimonadaceae bacterium]